MLWEQGVVGSNPATPTKEKDLSEMISPFFSLLNSQSKCFILISNKTIAFNALIINITAKIPHPNSAVG
jgi:hypothetical protein